MNNVKHKKILDDMVQKEFLERSKDTDKNRITIQYKISKKGLDLLHLILEPYEELFPREEKNDK